MIRHFFPNFNSNYSFFFSNFLAHSTALFQSLLNNQYLSSDYIDAFLQYLRIKSSFQMEYHCPLTFEALPRVREHRKKELHKAQIVFFPIIKDSHWTLAVVLNKSEEIHYWDSLGNSAPQYVETLLQNEFPSYKFINQSIKHQLDGVNCGMFLIYYCSHYLASKEGAGSIKNDAECTSETMFLLRRVVAAKFHSEQYLNKFGEDDEFFALSTLSPNLIKRRGRKATENKPAVPKTPTPVNDEPTVIIPSDGMKKVLQELEKLAPKLNTTELKNQLLFAAIHRIKSRQQREAFKQPLKKGEAKILIDFKSNIQIGMTCEQVFFFQKQKFINYRFSILFFRKINNITMYPIDNYLEFGFRPLKENSFSIFFPKILQRTKFL